MYKHILVPTDGSKLSGKAVTEAVKLAATCGAKITLLHVVSDYRKAMSETYAVPAAMAAPIQKKFQDEAATRSRKIIDTAGAVAKAASIPCGGVSVISDSPYETIIKQAGKSKCDVMVMASHGRRGLQGFLLGSETSKVLCYTEDAGARGALRRWCVQAIQVAPQPYVQHRPSAQFPCGCSGRIHPAYWRRVRRPGWRGWR